MRTITEITNAVEDTPWYESYEILKKWTEDILDEAKKQIYTSRQESKSVSEILDEIKKQL